YRRAGEELHVVRHMKDSLAVGLQIPVGSGSAVRPEREMQHFGRGPRPHGRDAHPAVGPQGGGNAFKDHAELKPFAKPFEDTPVNGSLFSLSRKLPRSV